MPPAASELIFTRMAEGRLTLRYLIIMTPCERLIRDEIARTGPISLSRFMEIALYDPVHGYYRRPRDPFGKEGDFYTAEQLQPAFGILVERAIRALYEEMDRPSGFTVVELGAGRGEMAEALRDFRYIPIDMERGALPEEFEGVVFANEFFDALPVDVFRWSGSEFRERTISVSGESLAWTDGEPAEGEALNYLQRVAPALEDGQIVEVHLEAIRWMERIAASLRRGYVLLIDYGYTRAEMIRHVSGTLMSYRKHAASEDVLATPGERDITAHVPFTMLEEAAVALGMERVRFETLASTLLRAGEADRFASVLTGSAEEQARRRLQLKTLLFGMGETFRTLLLRAPAGVRSK